MFRRFGSGRQTDNGADQHDTTEVSVRHGAGIASEAEILAGVDRLPALPVVVTRLLALVGSDMSSASDMERLIGQDMVIAGKLLKLVNSPFYGMANEIRSISQAVALIGFSSMRSLLLAVSTSDILNVQLAAYGFAPRGLWDNAMTTGSVAREIAKISGRPGEIADEYFVAGLLRDVGMLVLSPILERHNIILADRVDTTHDLIAAERTAIGFDHCWTGMRVAEKWQLPERLAFSIARHHRIPSTCADDRLHLVASVRLAERLVCKMGSGLTEHHPFRTAVDSSLLAATGLQSDVFRNLVGRLPEIVEHARDGV